MDSSRRIVDLQILDSGSSARPKMGKQAEIKLPQSKLS